MSLAFALNEATGAGLTSVEAAQIAHVAEIECKTGLGSVFAAVRGGFGVLTKPGAPGIGEAVSYPDQKRLRVVYLYFGPIPTKEALSNPALRAKINEMGGRFVDELAQKPTPERFHEAQSPIHRARRSRDSEAKSCLRQDGRRGLHLHHGNVWRGRLQRHGEGVGHLRLRGVLEKSFPGCEAVIVGID